MARAARPPLRVVRLGRQRRRDGGVGLWLRIGLVLLLIPFLGIGSLTAAGGAAAAGVYAYYTRGLKEQLAKLENPQFFESTKIYDRNGVLLYEFFSEGRRTVVPLEEIPNVLRAATLAAEDPTFYENPGVDVRGIVRATIQNLLAGRIVSGASTISQQLVKKVLFPYEEQVRKSFDRKIREAFLALELNRQRSKDEILELYLNEIYYGNLAYGVEAASRTYFAKGVRELGCPVVQETIPGFRGERTRYRVDCSRYDPILALAEAAFLAGLPQSPALYDPFRNFEAAKARQEHILNLMVEFGFATPEMAEAAKEKPLQIIQQPLEIEAPHFVFYVRDLLEKKYGPEILRQGGLKVYTTLDLELQKKAEEIAYTHVKEIEEKHNLHNAAVVILKPSTGEILAMVGSIDYNDPTIDGQVNVALAPRQPGSAFKPITYLTALLQGATPATIYLDVPVGFPLGNGRYYVPKNYDGKFHGPVRMRLALANSFNIPALKALRDVGIDKALEMAHLLGIGPDLLDKPPGYYGLSLTLGGGEVRLLDLATVYATLANRGERVDPVAILRVEDAQGRVLEAYDVPYSVVSAANHADPKARKPDRRPVLLGARAKQAIYLLTDILSDNQARVQEFGLNSPLKVSRPAAVKTGTTNDFRDNWTVGFTPYAVVGVWAGNSDNEPMVNSSGVTGAAPIWNEIMETIFSTPRFQNLFRDEEGRLEETFTPPSGLVRVEICAPTGKLPGPYCPEDQIVEEIFAAGTEPTEREQNYRPSPAVLISTDPYRFCLPNPAVPYPPGAVQERIFFFVDPDPKDPEEWVDENGKTWTREEALEAWYAEAGLAIPPRELCPPDAQPILIPYDQPIPGAIPSGVPPAETPGSPVGPGTLPMPTPAPVDYTGEIVVSYPAPWQVLRDPTTPVWGSATVQDEGERAFEHYRIEFAPWGSEAWQVIAGPIGEPRFNQLLTTWDVSGLPEGIYWIRSVVRTRDGRDHPSTPIPVVVERQAPRVRFLYPAGGTLPQAPQVLQIEVTSFAPIAVVEAYAGGSLIGISPSFPSPLQATKVYTLTWTPPGPGRYTLQAVARTSDGVQGLASVDVVVGEGVVGPAIQIVQPRNGQTLSAATPIAIYPSVSEEVARVVYIVNGTPVAEVAEPPFSIQWQASPGTYQIVAVAYAADGRELGRDEITVTVTP